MGDPSNSFLERVFGGNRLEAIKRTLILPKRYSEVPDPRILPEDVEKLQVWFRQFDPNLKLFRKIMTNVRCIDEAQLQKGLMQMDHAIDRYVGSAPYAVLIDSKNHGGGYILKRLKLKRQPKMILEHGNSESRQLQKELKTDDKLVFIDDASYGAGHANVMIGDILEETPVTPGNTMVALIGVTDQALRRITEDLRIPNITATYFIPQIREMFTSEEQRSIHDFSSATWAGNTDYAVLTYFGTHKVPDNFLGSLRKSITEGHNQPHLIDDTRSGIFPPYKTPLL